MLRRFTIASVCALTVALACGGDGGEDPIGVEVLPDGGSGAGGSAGSAGSAGTGGAAELGGVGDACSDAEPCRPGLACESGACAPGRSTPAGGDCVISGECEASLQCIGGICAPGGTGAEGETCTSDADCSDGLRCTLVGFGAECASEGTADVGGPCATSGDCFGGLTCAGGTCAPPPVGVPPFGVATWSGVSCQGGSSSPVRAYFEVPGATDPAGDEHDFFRLPFPSDILRSGGALDLSGFPVPGAGPLGIDPVALYRDAVVASESGWGLSPTVIFRFSSAVDHVSFREDSNANPPTRPVQWVDVTPGAPEYGAGSGLSWYSSEGGIKFVCPNYFAVRRAAGRPLDPGHTYAVMLTTDGKAKGGGDIERSPHLALMLAGTAPADASLAAAWQTFKPLRDFLADEGTDPTTILNATVLTVGGHRDLMSDLGAAVEAAPAPTASGWVKCNGSNASPCPDATGSRACGDSADALFDEYHAMVALPIFQKGTAPYEAAGGDIQTTGPVRTEDVCLSITVPAGAAPVGGWPLVVFAHGTGGNFRSHVGDDVAQALASVQTPGGIVNFAVLGIDQVQHGPRRGGSTRSPESLFFNFLNPDAARGNSLQGAADQIALARLANNIDVSAAQTGGDPIKIDPARVVFFGHSQGATHGSLALPYTDVYKGAVLSGNGASLMHALISKTKPVNIAGVLPFLLGDVDQDGKLASGDKHPVLSLLQHYIDPADPQTFARVIGAAPEMGRAPKHVFQTYGLADTYSPPITLQTFMLAARLHLGASHSSASPPDAIPGLMEEPVPLSATDMVGGRSMTLAAREYGPPGGSDGHFVAFDVAQANTDAARFLGMASRGDVPQVGP